MKLNLSQPILPAALLILLSAVFLPDAYDGFSTKDTYVADSVTSPVYLQDDALGNSDGDDKKISGSIGFFIVLPAPQHTSRSPNASPAPDIAFAVSQARAPPRF